MKYCILIYLILIATPGFCQQNYQLQLKFDIVESDKKPTKEFVITNIDNLLRRTRDEKCKYIIGGDFSLQEFVNNKFILKTENAELKLSAGYVPLTETRFKVYYNATLSYPMQENLLNFVNDLTMDYHEVKIISESKLVDGIRDTRPYWVILRIKKREPEYIEKNIGNIGLVLSIKDGRPYVLTIVKESPAEKCNIKPNDVILEVDDICTFGKSLQEIVDRIRGKPFTTVKLKIKSAEATREVTVERKILRLP